ncbi:POT family-domain-containing protein [Mucidula mucida]|nr:POT family-domain-containing protein [Mucidula mucida]
MCSAAAHAQATIDYESAPVNPGGLPITEKEKEDSSSVVAVDSGLHFELEDYPEPTEEEFATLRKVPAHMPWAAIAMCLIEFAERASYYGCTQVFANFVRGALPAGGNGAGAVAPGAAGLNQSAGALGLGSEAATAVTQTFTFLAYCIPIFGGIVADTRWGRFKAICVGTAIGAIAHVLLVVPAIPSVIASGHALAPFIIAFIILAFAAGFIKPSLAPLLCDQSPVKHPRVTTTKSGERVILDPTATVQRYLLIFYFCINVGAFFGLATSYAAHNVGFWLAFLTPGIIYMVMPIVLVGAFKRLYKAPPQGSVVLEASHVVKYLFNRATFKSWWKGGDAFWDHAKPSAIAASTGHPVDVSVINWDDKFVDELRQSFSACKVFFLIPIFNLADGGLGNSENAMSASMTVNGVPNDLLNNFNPLSIIVATPIITYGLYPMLQKFNIPFPAMWRIAVGFLLASINMIFGAVIQWRTSPCGYAASTCATVSPVSLWWQIPLYTLPAVGEIFVNVTSYEIAYTRAPARMKGLVYSMVLFTSALSSALSLALTAVVDDPFLIWPHETDMNLSLSPVVFNDTERMEGKQQPTAIVASDPEKTSSTEKI